jgi:N-acetylglucosamine repressor
VRRIDVSQFKVAKRGTSREINRQIALNLVRTKQPTSRADLARLMGMRRGAVTLLVNELIAAGLIFEGAKGPSKRGRRPKYLFIDSRRRCVVAVDMRASRTYLQVTDLLGHPLLDVVDVPTEKHAPTMVAALAVLIRKTLDAHPAFGTCSGIGVCAPGMVDRTTRRLVYAPTLGWRDVEIEHPLSHATGLPVHIENSVRACALAQVWEARNEIPASGDLVFVGIADGVGSSTAGCCAAGTTSLARSATCSSPRMDRAVRAAPWAAGKPTSRTWQPSSATWVWARMIRRGSWMTRSP